MGRKSKWAGVRARDGGIEIDFRFRGVRCREKLRILPTPANLARAERHRFAILASIEAGTFDYATVFPDSAAAARFAQVDQPAVGYPVAKYLEEWLERQKACLHASTWRDYDKTVRLLASAIGNHSMADLRRAHVREWCEKQTCGNKRLSNIQSVLRTALDEAVHDDVIEVNIMAGWKYARKQPPRVEDDVDPFGVEEQTAILDACTNPQGRNLLQFAFWSGLRTSELCALEWGDIDWTRGIINVRRAFTQAAEEPEEPKTKRGAREVKLLAQARAALQAQKAHTLLRGRQVFMNPRTGEPWAGDQPIRKTLWTGTLERAGVRYRRPYQTRHTYASMMLTAGESPVWVAQQMGHADMTMIARVYGRWIANAVPDAGGKAEAMFTRPAK